MQSHHTEQFGQTKRNIYDFPQQLVKGLKCAGDAGRIFQKRNIGRIVVAGMGGSALPAELLRSSARDIHLKLPILIHRNYDLPYSIQKNDLVICISYSGNTEETLSAYTKARGLGLALVAIANGGQLMQKAKKDKAAFVEVPGGVVPRLAMGYQFSALLAVLANAGIIKSQNRALKEASLQIDTHELEKYGKLHARKIKQRIPLFYASSRYRALAYILKIEMNENAEIHSFWNVFPELNHNEMVGYSRASSFHPERYITFFIKCDNDHPRIKKRMLITENMLKRNGYKTCTLRATAKNPFTKMFRMIILGDWIGFYYAVQRGVDPASIAIVEEFKQKMKS